MMKPLRLAAVAALFSCVHLLSPGQASAEAVRIGVLTCQVDGKRLSILGSRRELSCIFERAGGGPAERYAGEIRRLGIDVGTTNYSSIAWAVMALTNAPYFAKALEGSYGGVSAGVALGVGIGANALIGGFNRSFALQPFSVEATRGVNLALAVASLQLYGVGEFR
jgi:hypothetical protein